MPNADRIHAPTDIGDWYLNTRSMFKNRIGRPRSEISRTGDTRAPNAISQNAACAIAACPVTHAAHPTLADIPANPPMKK